MNIRDFLSLAQKLVNKPTEVAWRSAVSRAYYAAFHVARQLLNDLGFQVPRADRAHAYLWRRLSKCGDATVQNAGRELNDLRGDRNEADYNVDRPLPQAVATGQVGVAKRIIEILDSASAKPTRSTLVDAIRIYERDILKEETWKP